MIKKLFVTMIGVLLLSGMLSAQTIAYDATVQPGNQGWTGNLGLDFNVTGTRAILVTALGAFDNNGNGFTGGVTVGIFNRVTGTQVGPSATISGSGGTLVNGDRFVAVAPFTLAPGEYSVVAVGFNAIDLNGNVNCVGNATDACVPANPYTASMMNPGGVLSFVGSGRFDANTTLDFPATVPAGFPPNVFLAGTFQFQTYVAATLTKTLPNEINFGQTVPASFSVGNPNPVPLTGVTFTDVLPSGLQVQIPNGLTGSCTAGSTGSVPTTTTSITFNGTLAAGGSCTFSVNVVGIAAGEQTNGPVTVTSNEAPPGTSAPVTVFVDSWWLWFFYST